jgi:parallel beta-helix repeat protein
MYDPTATVCTTRTVSRLRLARVAAAIGVACGSLAVALVADEAGASDIIHVSPSGDDSASGDAGSPVRTIEQAVRRADPGDTVEIADGVYHESIQVYAKEVHLVAAPGADVVLDGARSVEGWSAAPGGWSAPWTTDFERVEAPFTTPDNPQAGWPEQFFLDGQPLAETTSIDDLDPGEFYVDKPAGRVVIADDPSGRLVEGSDLNWGIYLNDAHGSSIDGLTVRRYATQNRNMAAIRAYADDLTIVDTTVESNARIGLSAMGDRISLIDVRAIDNGHLGLHGHRSSDLTMTDVRVTGNNREGFDAKHSAGGIKVTDSQRLLIESSVVSDNAGPGIWTDLDVTDSVIKSSVAERNGRSGIEIELSENVVVFGNVVVENGEAGIWVLESSQVEVWHNTALHNVRDIWVLDGDRADLVGTTVVNNVLGGGAEGAQAIFNADDWTQTRSATDMQVRVESNRYWIDPDSPTQLISRWANWPQPLALSGDLDAHRSATGQAEGSDLIVSTDNPFARSPSDPRQPESAPIGVAIPQRIADAVGTAGAHPAGAMTLVDPAVTTTGTTRTSTSPSTGARQPDGTDGADSPTLGTRPGSAGSTETQSTNITTRGASSPGAVPEGAELAVIGRSGQVATATPAEAPVAPASPAVPAQPEPDHAANVDVDGTDDSPNQPPATSTQLRSAGWGAVRDHIEAALETIV